MRWLRLALDVVQNRLGGVPRPRWCTYLVTFRCNARCGMCDSWRMKPGSELTPEQAAGVFGKVAPLDVVRLTGGEPFLRDDFAELAGAVERAASPAVVHITSNGSFPERVSVLVKQFPAPAKLRFMISVDGMPQEHDANRGADVTFALVEETVRRLVEMRRTHGLAVSVNHTIISARSLEDHVEVCRRFEPLGVDVHAVLAYADSAMYGLKRFGKKATDLIVPAGYPLHPDLAGSDVAGLVRRLLHANERMRDPVLRLGKRYYLRGLLNRLRSRSDNLPGASGSSASAERGDSPPHHRPSPRCVALRSHLRLLPDGSVPVCQFNTERVGNLHRQSFEEVWHNPAAKASRDWVDACPGCWAECEVMPNALFTGDLLFPA
ncbi:MAG: radical SAM protein [Gemmataceae bacterium]|nr:radical SAM protein [Gemmataceae bacterium]